MGGERVRQIREKALRKLQHPSRSRMVEGLLPFAENSIATSHFGARVVRELPERLQNRRRSVFGLTDETLQELPDEEYRFKMNQFTLLSHDLGKYPLSEQALQKVLTKFNELAALSSEPVEATPKNDSDNEPRTLEGALMEVLSKLGIQEREINLEE